MFFLFSKILSFLLMPLTWFFVLLIISWRTKEESKKRRVRIAAILLIVVFSNQVIFDRTMRIWEINAVEEPKAVTFDALIVLGGLSSYDPQLDRIQFSRGADRLLQAIELWKKGIAKKIIFTGGSGSILHDDILESDKIRDYLKKIGIPDSVMIYENKSRNTHENAALTKVLLKNHSLNGKYLLVTSAFHMRRAMACFTKEGISVTPYSVDRYSGPWKLEFDYLFLPSAETLSDWNTLLHEWVGCITYKFRGYI